MGVWVSVETVNSCLSYSTCWCWAGIGLTMSAKAVFVLKASVICIPRISLPYFALQRVRQVFCPAQIEHREVSVLGTELSPEYFRSVKSSHGIEICLDRRPFVVGVLQSISHCGCHNCGCQVDWEAPEFNKWQMSRSRYGLICRSQVQSYETPGLFWVHTMCSYPLRA